MSECLLRLQILRLLMGKVVIGHAVHNDFKVLSYSHPAAMTRDTSRIPLLNLKAGFAVSECASLKRLTKAILCRDIQVGASLRRKCLRARRRTFSVVNVNVFPPKHHSGRFQQRLNAPSIRLIRSQQHQSINPSSLFVTCSHTVYGTITVKYKPLFKSYSRNSNIFMIIY